MWEYRGIKGGANPPPCLGQYRGNLIIVGGARCVWDDYMRVIEKGFDGSAMAVNDVGMYFDKPINHWVSVHAGFLCFWAALRKGHRNDQFSTHTNESFPGIDMAWDIQPTGWTSGMFAAQVGVALGYDKIVLCGLPQDDTGRFCDPPWAGGGEHADKNSKKGFRTIVEQTPELKARVRSMSGWTKEVFGEP